MQHLLIMGLSVKFNAPQITEQNIGCLATKKKKRLSNVLSNL